LSDGELFDKVRPTLVACALCCRFQTERKEESGTPAAVKDGGLAIPSHASAAWIVMFMDMMASQGSMALCIDWKDIAGDVERELLPLANAEALFQYTKDDVDRIWLQHQIE
jgi:hypothetical protein